MRTKIAEAKPMKAILAAVVLCLVASVAHAQLTATANFHTIGLYWSRPEVSGGISLQYKVKGTTTWKNAQPLWYDSSSPNISFKNQYRGSIVNLRPGTGYNVRYRLGSGGWVSAPDVTTRSDAFPSSGNTVRYGGRILTNTLVITEGGAVNNWRVYDGQGTAIIDTDHRSDCVAVRASYVILRNFTIRDCRGNAIVVERSNVVVEGSTISDWGLQQLYYQTKPLDGHYLSEPTATCVPGVLKTDFGRPDDAGVNVRLGANDGIVIQRNTIRDPRYRSTRWHECPSPGYASHPWGPRAISILASAADVARGNVIRYNNIYAANVRSGGAMLSNNANRYYDAIGVPYQQDTDIYGNIVRNATDDLIEADNAAVNVRIWGNYLDYALTRISHQKMEAGPSYIFRNIFDRGADAGPGNPGTWDVLVPYGTKPPVDSGAMLKLKQDNGVGDATFKGPVYIFHNTALRAGEDGMRYAYDMGRADEAAKAPNDMPGIISKNNIFLSSLNYIRDVLPTSFVSYYFGDMHNRSNDTNTAYVLGPGNLQAAAIWKAGHGPGLPLGTPWTAPAVPTGKYQVANAGDGVAIDNFNDPANRGRGAHPFDPDADDPMRFGVDANWTYTP